MKYCAQFTYENTCEQTVTGTVAFDEVHLIVSEKGSTKDYLKLYFTSKEEVCTLIEMLSAMSKNME